MHFAQNLGCSQAQHLGLDDAAISIIQAAVGSTCQKNPSADPVCLKACGLPVPPTLNSC
jgi:hypothetical protein